MELFVYLQTYSNVKQSLLVPTSMIELHCFTKNRKKPERRCSQGEISLRTGFCCWFITLYLMQPGQNEGSLNLAKSFLGFETPFELQVDKVGPKVTSYKQGAK